MLVLLAIGLVHSYLIWMGDILVLYAECGLLLYFFRNLRPRTLIICGILALLVAGADHLGLAAMADSMKAAAKRVEAQKQAGEKPSPRDERLAEAWNEGLQQVRRARHPSRKRRVGRRRCRRTAEIIVAS